MSSQSTAPASATGRSEDGDLVPLELVEVPNGESARRRAATAATQHAGAIAFSRTGDPSSGEFADAVILATYGEVTNGSPLRSKLVVDLPRRQADGGAVPPM